MKRFIAVLIGLAVGAAAGVALLAARGGSAPGFLAAPPAAFDPGVPTVSADTGVGEELLLVVGGVYATRQQAVAAADTLDFGDVQGYYVVPVAQFRGFRELLGASPGDFALVSAFRTQEGAEEFASFVEGFAGAPARIVGPVVSLGGVYAGLGQEAHPNGRGPLLGPLVPSPPKGP